MPISHLVHFWKFDSSRPNRHSRQFTTIANYVPLKVYQRSPATFPKTQLNDSKISLMVNNEHREPLWQTDRQTDRHCLILIRLGKNFLSIFLILLNSTAKCLILLIINFSIQEYSLAKLREEVLKSRLKDIPTQSVELWLTVLFQWDAAIGNARQLG